MISVRSTLLASAWGLLQLAPSLTQATEHSGHSQRHVRSSVPIPPTKDPWYTAPAGFETEKPGAILRVRQAPGNLTSLFANCSAAYNVLYRTTDSRYNPDWAVTTIFLPDAPAPALLSYQIPYDSADVDESPSYALYAAPDADISEGLSNGWIVNVPDYEGPLAAFTAGVLSGHSTIDSIRATLNANKTLGWELVENAPYALWGYSGGALASEWAAELQIQYAPEMNFSGAALGGLTPNVTSVLYTINNGIGVGLAPASILGIASQYPEIQSSLISRLKTDGPFNATGFLATRDFSLDEALVAYAFQDVADYFIGGITDLKGPEFLKAVNRDGVMGYHGTPQMPIFAYKAIGDAISVIEDTDALLARYCNNGANILYNRNTVGGHGAEEVNGRPAALSFLTSVLKGTYAQHYSTSGCITQSVTVNISSSPFRKRDINDYSLFD